MSYCKRSILICIFGLSISCTSHSTNVSCPLKVTTTQQLVGDYVGWKPFSDDAAHFVDGVSFYSGNPAEKAVLKPDSFVKDKATWRFATGEIIYMVCHYNQTIIRLSQALPAYTTQCQVSYNLSVNGANGPIPTHISCNQEH